MNKEVSISILGLGLIGGSIAKSLKQTRPEIQISAFDNPETLELAINDNIIDKKISSIQTTITDDIIFICLPVDYSIDVFRLIAPKLKPGQILTDVCSVKQIFKDIWDDTKSDGTYIGGHPMTGKEKSGYINSDPLLFENSIYIVTEDISQNPIYYNFRGIITLLGANILHIPAKQHDVIAASVSHLPQLISVALVNTASLKTDDYNFLDLAAGGFRDMTRIAASDFNIWKPVLTENRNEILAAIEKFQDELSQMKKSIEKKSIDNLYLRFEEARIKRDEIPKNTKGFLSPLFDIFVFVKDEPGVLSKITTALFNNGINIKDIELLKIREGSGGTFRLSFTNKTEAEAAKKIINSVGFNVV